MFCPSCKCEYIRGATECPDCGVALVDALESPESQPAEAERIVVAWRGDDLSECARLKNALRAADIPFADKDSKSYTALFPNEAGTEILISEADQDRVRKIILDLEGRVDPDELSPQELESLALPESNEPGEEAAEPEDPGEDWGEDEPVAEVWTGESETVADSLIACLQEVGIASRKVFDASQWRLDVRPEQKSRAKEIVREVVEASPPK